MKTVLFCVLFLFLSSMTILQNTVMASNSTEVTVQQDENCSLYFHQVVKPMMEHVGLLNQKIVTNDAEIKTKNYQIKQLEEKEINLNKQIVQLEEKDLKNQIEIKQLEKNLTNLETESTIYKTKEEFLGKILKEIRSQSEKIDKLKENMCSDQVNQIIDLEKKIYSIENELSTKEKNVNLYEKQLKCHKKAIALKEKQISQLETEAFKKVNQSISNDTMVNPTSCFSYDSFRVVHILTLSDGSNVQVLCNSDIADGGWTVILQRINGGVDFDRCWYDFKDGFGEFHGDFFLGLESIHRLTANQSHELLIYMERFNDDKYFARYDEFAISGADDEYRLTKLGKYNGTLSDELREFVGNKFSTIDRDNDDGDFNCAEKYSAWWYKGCGKVNLNGHYFDKETEDWTGITWDSAYNLKTVKMLIRPKTISN